jgi:hypothetical protein
MTKAYMEGKILHLRSESGHEPPILCPKNPPPPNTYSIGDWVPEVM